MLMPSDFLLNEYLYRVLLSINRLDRIAKSSDLTFNTQTYLRILDKILSTQSVPFSGEPLSGIQIMGILETRSLDFENIIMLSVNEGILPAATAGSSFIPFNIREAFGLPTINHQESIFAYHFYRLLQRAKKVMLVYNSNSEGLRTGEVSRFVTQMKYEQILRQEYMNLNFNIKSTAVIGPLITRTKRHSDRLISIFNAREGKSMLSPSAINTWLNCRMKFYYRYVNGLRETEKVRGIADYAMLGDLLHRLMKNIYEKYQGTNVNKEHFNSLINSEVYLLNLIDKTFHEKDNPEIEKVPDGNELIIKDILLLYLKRILKADRAVSPFRIISLEKPYGFEVTCKAGNKNIAVRTGGTVDRIDIKNDNYRIVDYKTGEVARSISSTDDLFREDRKPDSDGWLQTLLYCEAFFIKTGDIRLKPSIYRIRELSDQNLTDTLKIKTGKNQEFLLEDYTEIRNQFLDGLSRTIEVIFNDGEDFRMTDDLQKCNYCPYRALCQR
jgi:CRISPR/Cas system-associated exonuclease Cas4 (RecB family)